MERAAAGAAVLRFPVERRLADIRAEREAEEAVQSLMRRASGAVPVPGGEQLALGANIEMTGNYAMPLIPVGTVLEASTGADCNYVFDAGFFGVRLRP